MVEVQQRDISRSSLFVLVILTLLISMLGTWGVLSQINAGHFEPAQSIPSSSGKVSVEIVNPSAFPQSQTGIGSATGYVGLEIRK